MVRWRTAHPRYHQLTAYYEDNLLYWMFLIGGGWQPFDTPIDGSGIFKDVIRHDYLSQYNFGSTQ